MATLHLLCTIAKYIEYNSNSYQLERKLCSNFLRASFTAAGPFRPPSLVCMKTHWYRFQFSNGMLAKPTLSRACLTAPIQLHRCPGGADQSQRDPYHTSQGSSQSPAARAASGRAPSQVRTTRLQATRRLLMHTIPSSEPRFCIGHAQTLVPRTSPSRRHPRPRHIRSIRADVDGSPTFGRTCVDIG